MTPLLSVHHLTKQFSNSRFSINDVSFQVDPGAVSYTHLTLPTILRV